VGGKLVPAAIFVQRGAPAEKQRNACIDYALGQHWSVLAIVPPGRPDDAVTLAKNGRIDHVLAAFDSKAVQQLAADLDGNAQLVVVHPEPRVIEPPKHKLGTLGELILRWFRSGKTVKEIAELADGDTTDVRAILRRHGEDPGRSG
jgi:DNA-binding NarL/FixJ family response regulator